MSRAQELAESVMRSADDMANAAIAEFATEVSEGRADEARKEIEVGLIKLVAYCESLEKDAGRFRWLLDNAQDRSDGGDGIVLVSPVRGTEWHRKTTEAIDAAIDASHALDGGK